MLYFNCNIFTKDILTYTSNLLVKSICLYHLSIKIFQYYEEVIDTLLIAELHVFTKLGNGFVNGLSI